MRTTKLARALSRATAGGIIAALVVTGVAAEAAALDEMEVLLENGDLSVTGVPEHLGNIAPGDSRDWIVLMRNESGDPIAITGRVVQLADDDDGCEDPESDVDSSCGPGEGEAQDALQLSMLGQAGSTPIALSDIAAQLPTVTVPPRSTVERTLRLELPSSTGNEVQSDRVQFNMSWTAHGPGFVATAPSPSPGKRGLAFTGAWVGLLALLGGGLLAFGTALVLSARQRRIAGGRVRGADGS